MRRHENPKFPEGCVCVFRCKRCRVALGIPKSASYVFDERKLSVHAHSTHWNKMAICDFGPVTVISCETALFFVYIWTISWDATNRLLIQRLIDR